MNRIVLTLPGDENVSVGGKRDGSVGVVGDAGTRTAGANENSAIGKGLSQEDFSRGDRLGAVGGHLGEFESVTVAFLLPGVENQTALMSGKGGFHRGNEGELVEGLDEKITLVLLIA